MKLIIDIPEEDYKFIKSLRSLIIGGRGNCKTIQKNVINAIRNGVPYEVRPKGKWIYVCCYGDEYPQCSVCGEINDVKTNFCPDCGADMRGEENG